VAIEKKSGLYELLDADQIWVNSCHHQAIRHLAKGLFVAARSSDGLIEAVELPWESFCVGVQWHPERLGYDNPSSCAMFRAFIEACCR
jgi:putative glutamine amidotransferase